MRIECVITCSHYEDYLRITLPFTLAQVDDLVVVTSDREDDEPTRQLCRRNGVRCLSTDAFYRKGASFRKGAAINKGLDAIGGGDWTLHLDADLVLPPTTRQILSRLDLSTNCLFGIDRVNCPTAAAWKEFVSQTWHQVEWHCLVNSPGQFPIMGRYHHPDDGYVPIGYFQLWHRDSRHHAWDKRYPTGHADACRTDVQFALQWDGPRRRLIPDLIAVHLQACPTPIGANWNGRATPAFDLDQPTPSGEGLRPYYGDNGQSRFHSVS